MPLAGCTATIQVLPGDVISRIAAGEVIERPAAVVKELIENSLDAGSRRIAIDIKDGGPALIRVTDDGGGIRRADLPLAFERHATSKLRSDRDLTSVMTLGFRGEALPSIAAVSHVEVTTATEQDHVGARLRLIGGVQQAVVDASPVIGTTIEVSELFYNQPARKKFLKSVMTEFSHIGHTVQQAALAWPSVHFRLTHNGQEVLNCPIVESDRDRILQIYRPGFLERSIEVRGRIPGCAIRGLVVNPLHARSSRTPQDLFVNRRPVRNAAVFHAVTEAYGSCLTRGYAPTFVLFMEIDPGRIDVNVHPAKREIRFADQEPIQRLVRHAVRHAVGGPERSVVSETPTPEAVASSDHLIPSSDAPATSGSTGYATATESRLSLVHEAAASYTIAGTREVVALGQILRRYLVAQVGPELQVIDQHTAHERVLFQRLWRRWQDRDVTSQPLLIPEPVELPAAEHTLLQRHLDDLAALGLLMEPFGATTFVIRAVPTGVGPLDGLSLVKDVLDDLVQWDRASSLDQRVQPLLASLACHSAVRAGRSMALPEIRQLVEDWVEEGLIVTCPHGRRTSFRLSTDELDKLFGRVGWS